MREQDKDILDIVEEPGPGIREDQLLRTIWIYPRHTLRYIFKHCPDKYVWGLLVFGGMAGALSNSNQYANYTGITGFLLLFISIGAGAILGPLANIIFAALLRWTASWIDGATDFNKILTVLAWSLVPTIASLIFFLGKWLYFGNELFLGNTDLSYRFSNVVYSIFSIGETILTIWSLVIAVIGVSEANNFGIGKSILNHVLVFVAIVLIVFIFVIFISLFGI